LNYGFNDIAIMRKFQTEIPYHIWLSNLLTMSVPGEGYYRNAPYSTALNKISTVITETHPTVLH